MNPKPHFHLPKSNYLPSPLAHSENFGELLKTFIKNKMPSELSATFISKENGANQINPPFIKTGSVDFFVTAVVKG